MRLMAMTMTMAVVTAGMALGSKKPNGNHDDHAQRDDGVHDEPFKK
jgi:hypothetical protein